MSGSDETWRQAVEQRKRRVLFAARKLIHGGREAVVVAAERELAQHFRLRDEADRRRREAEQQRIAAERAEQELLRRLEAASTDAEINELIKHLPIEKLLEYRQMADARRVERLSRIRGQAIPLETRGNAIVFGSDYLEHGQPMSLPLEGLTHTLVIGTAGFGKTVFLHQMIWQFLVHADVDQVVLVDLKGGMEFDRYSDFPKARVVWEYADVMSAIADLVREMNRRQELMRQTRQKWRGGRTILIIDEYFDVNSPPTRDKAGKVLRDELLDGLAELSRKARASGFLIFAATQKATIDAMDSGFRNNLATQVCFRVGSRRVAVDMFGDLEDIAVDPMRLKRGRFILRTAGGNTHYLKAHVAPGIEVGGYL